MPSFKIIKLMVPKKKMFKGLYHIWAWPPSWSSDQDHIYKFISGSTYNLALIGQEVSEKMFEDNGPIHVHSPRGRGRQPPGGQYFFQNINLFSILVICCKLLPLNDFA